MLLVYQDDSASGVTPATGSSSLNGCAAENDGPILVDTQLDGGTEEEAAETAKAVAEHAEIQEREDRELQQLVEDYEARQAAQQFRDGERRQFEEEMNAAPPKLRRMQVSMRVSTSTTRGANARISIPVPAEGETTFITLALGVKNDTHKTQTSTRSTTVTTSMDPPLPDRHDQTALVQTTKHAVHEQAEMILGRLRSYLQQSQGREPEDDLRDLLIDAGAAMQLIAATESYGARRRRRTASSSSMQADADNAQKQDVEDLAEDTKSNIDLAVASRPYEHRAEILKAVAVGIVRDTQLLASRLRVLLLLLGHYLPQQRTDNERVNAASSFEIACGEMGEIG